MKQELINEFEAALAFVRAGQSQEKAGLLLLANLEAKALEAGADPAKVARIKADYDALVIRHKKSDIAYKAFHERVDTEFIKTGQIVPFTGT